MRKTEPPFEGVYFDLADVYLQLGRTSDALAVLRDAARRWPGDAKRTTPSASCSSGAARWTTRSSPLSAACTVAPHDPIGHFNLGYAHHLRYQRWLRTSRRHRPRHARRARAPQRARGLPQERRARRLALEKARARRDCRAGRLGTASFSPGPIVIGPRANPGPGRTRGRRDPGRRTRKKNGPGHCARARVSSGASSLRSRTARRSAHGGGTMSLAA